MQRILYQYEMNPTTWVYLSSLITIAVYFKFRRFWSVRNLDLIGLILFAPGLLLLAYGKESANPSPAHVTSDARPAQPPEPGGVVPAATADAQPKAAQPAENSDRSLELLVYRWLFAVSLFFLVRMLIDPAMVRRPLLEPNLSASGLTFACASMLVFLMSNIITERPEIGARNVAEHALANPGETARVDKLPTGDQDSEIRTILKLRGPGYPLFQAFANESNDNAKRITAILAHLVIVLGMVLIGYRHFDNTHTGIAAATLYLLLPYTAQYTPRLDHIIPGALLVLAIQTYRRPVASGIFMGLAAGLTYYPLFLLPLWCSFYWRRGLIRFSSAAAIVLVLVIASLAFTPPSLGTFWEQFQRTIGAPPIHVRDRDIQGLWTGLAAFRLPVMVVFFAMCGSMVLWPAQKNLGSLLACSAAIMLGTQFWMAYHGGTFMAWYLPLLILTILRPNLEDRVALSAISEGWVKWRK